MNIDIVLFAGRIVLVALLYIFLFAVMKTGVGLVRGQRRDSAIWTIDVDKGPRGIRGIHVDMLGPVIVGRSPSSDICINEPFVSASHARFSLQGRRSSSRTSTRLTARSSTAASSWSPRRCVRATKFRLATWS